MRKYIVLFILALSLNFKVNAQYFKLPEIIEENLKFQSKRRKLNLRYLSAAKVMLISGNVKRAKRELQNIQDPSDKVLSVKLRYLAMANFIEGRYQESLKILEHPLFKKGDLKKRTCVMAIANRIIMDQMYHLEDDLYYCLASNFKYTSNDQAWLNFLVDVKNRDYDVLRGNFLASQIQKLQTNEWVRLWIKMALYTNQEQKVIDLLQYIPAKAYRSKKIRELMGFLYYRIGQDDMSSKFIEDIDSPNAENIRGNISLEKKQYEVAYGHFQLALKYKPNSLNAIERSITLAWILGQFEEGLQLTNKISTHGGKQTQKKVIKAAFLTRLGQFDEVIKELLPIIETYVGSQPLEVNQLASYSYLRMRDKDQATKFSQLSCKHLDGLACWMLYQFSLWPDFSQTIYLDEPVYQDMALTYESLMENNKPNPIVEDKFIDQKDIDELDDINAQELL